MQWRRGGSVPDQVGGVDTSAVSVAESGSYAGLDHYEDLATELSSYGNGRALYRGEELSPVVGVARCAAGKWAQNQYGSSWEYGAFSAAGERTRWAFDDSGYGAFSWINTIGGSLDYKGEGHSAVAVFDTERKLYFYGLVKDFGKDHSVNRAHALAVIALLGERARDADIALAKVRERATAYHNRQQQW